jgi:hypothetical protein
MAKALQRYPTKELLIKLCLFGLKEFLMLISRVSKIKLMPGHPPLFRLVSPSKENETKKQNMSRNTSDSWVKKATGGLSPGSMAPLSSAVNVAASAYGVGFGSFFLSLSLALFCAFNVRDEEQRTHFLSV